MPHLIFAYANQQAPQGFLRALAHERKAVKAALDLAEQMGLCTRTFIDDASAGDILNAFQRHDGEVVLFHYGGHAGSFELLLQTEEGDSNQAAGGEGLVSFLAHQRSLQVVLLNGCHTERLAEQLTEAGIPLVVGTDQAVNDRTATQWATRFYRGLGVGLSIQRAFDDAVDEIRMSPQGKELRSLYLRSTDAIPSDVPWRLQWASGKEEARRWSLTQYNPLLGLPEPVVSGDLPDPPFLFFRRYDRRYAPVFFGRAQHIRLLYDRIANPDSPPLILLHGQSGSGKSSLLEAGLLPRLEADYLVRYLRREANTDLTDVLTTALQALSDELPGGPTNSRDSEALSKLLRQLEQQLEDHPRERALQQQLQGLRTLRQQLAEDKSPPDAPHAPLLLQQWQRIESQTGRPLIIILDQLEAVFTQNDKQQEEREWKAFLHTLRQLFGQVADRPRGKLILGFRKEYFPEVEKALQGAALPRSNIFLPTLTRPEIEEIVLGLTSRPELRERYQLQIDPSLPGLIAEELLQKEEATVAPILQIMLTNMWQDATEQEPHRPQFTVALYRQLKSKWWQLDRFVNAQIAKIAELYPKAVAYGLLLDVLYEHITPGNTAQSLSLGTLQEQYDHAPSLQDLLSAADNHLLLKRERGGYGLGHDTLAPVIRRMYQQSDRAGQRARRIIEGRIAGNPNDIPPPLDQADLAQVQRGLSYMRRLQDTERDLLARSEAAASKKKRQRTAVMATLLILALLTVGALLYGYWINAQKVQTEASLEEMKQERDQLDQELAGRQFLLDSTQSSLSQQQRSLAALQDSTQQLSQLAQATEIRAGKAERLFQANQLAANALAYLQEEQKYESLQAAVAAYRQAPQSPAVLGTLLTVAYDTSPVFQARSDFDYQLQAVHPAGLRLASSFTGFQIVDPAGVNVYRYPALEFIDSLSFVAGYPDRAYFRVRKDEKIVVWQPVLPRPQTLITGRIIGLVAADPAEGIRWTTAAGHAGTSMVGEETTPRTALSDRALSLSASPQGPLLIAQPTVLQFYPTPAFTNSREFPLEDRSLAFSRARFSSDGRHVVAAQTRGQVTIYRVGSGGLNAVTTVSATTAADAIMIDAVLSPDARYLLAVDNQQRLYLWDWPAERLLATYNYPAALSVLAFSPDGRYLTIGGADGLLYRMTWRGARTSLRPDPAKAFRTSDGLGVVDVAFQPSLPACIAIAAGQEVYVYDWATRLPIWRYKAGQQILQITFSDRGRHLWIGTTEGLLSPIVCDANLLVKNIIQQRFISDPL